jgi:hypothetical protein
VEGGLGSLIASFLNVFGQVPPYFDERNCSICVPKAESFLKRLNPIENVHVIVSAHREDGWTKLSDRSGKTRIN